MTDHNDPETWGQRIMAWWASVHELVERECQRGAEHDPSGAKLPRDEAGKEVVV